jgi:hypothetical protein
MQDLHGHAALHALVPRLVGGHLQSADESQEETAGELLIHYQLEAKIAYC